MLKEITINITRHTPLTSEPYNVVETIRGDNKVQQGRKTHRPGDRLADFEVDGLISSLPRHYTVVTKKAND